MKKWIVRDVKMNYEKELSSFYGWLELHTLTPSAINLWYALMHINHKTGWAETFSVAESVLSIKTSLTDRTLRKVRKELKEKGRIDYISRKGKAPIYRIIPFQEGNLPSEPLQPKKEVENDGLNSEKRELVDREFCSKDDQSLERNSEGYAKEPMEVCLTPGKNSVIHSGVRTEEASSSEKISAICSALFRQQQTDKRIQATWNDLVDAWRSVFGFEIRVNHVQMLDTYMEEDHMSKSLILEAIERVKQATKPVMNYLWKVLSNWANLGIQNIKDLVRHEKKRVHASPSVRSNRPVVQSRDIPKGFHLDLTEGEDWP